MIKAGPLPKPRRLEVRHRRAPDARRRCWRFVALLAAAMGSVTVGLADEFRAGERAFSRHDYERAVAIFSREAERGDAAAQTYLGSMYAEGRGVPQNQIAATQWLGRAADQGFPAAQFLLGLMYDKGHGVKQDFVQAEVLLDLAAAHAELKQRDFWTRIRNAVASKLTQDELAEAQRRALEFLPIQER